jgi:hypothetical protein
MTASRSSKKKKILPSLFFYAFLINRSFIPMESSVKGQERGGEYDLILRDLDFPDAAFEADRLLGPTHK